MSYCKECNKAIDQAWQLIMAQGLEATDYRSLDDIALDIAYDQGWTCASKGNECEDNLIKEAS